MASKIDTKAKRDSLKPRREPYWAKVQEGAHVGYRRATNGGTWIARFREEDGKQKYRALALPDHLPVNVYDTAVSEARKWFAGIQVGVKPRAGTVAEAAADYEAALKARKGVKASSDAKGRIRRLIERQLGKRKLDKLTTTEIENWFFAMVPADAKGEALRKARASANRNLSTLKAILNRAHVSGLVSSSLAWDRVKPFEKVDGARKIFLDRNQVRALIEKSEGAFRDLAKTAAITGARYGELCALRVRDFEKTEGVLQIREGKTGERIVPLTAEMVAHFKQLSKNKLPDAFMLARDDGKQWAHSDHDDAMRAAVKAAKLPSGTVFYTLRHSFIAAAISAGMDIYSVATITGTSVRMIEKHYGKLLKGRVREAMTAAAFL